MSRLASGPGLLLAALLAVAASAGPASAQAPSVGQPPSAGASGPSGSAGGTEPDEPAAVDAPPASPLHQEGLALVHVVRPGEKLASIAQRYYGDPRREAILVAENGLEARGGSSVTVGMRLVVPHVRYHVVREGESWRSLAERFYGMPERAFLLASVNGASPRENPDVGAEILVPHPLRHVAEQNETLVQVARRYYGDRREAKLLRRFNRLRGRRLQRGQIVLVPLSDLVLSEEGRALAARQYGRAPSGGERRALQARIAEQLPALREHVVAGRYAEALALGYRLLGSEACTGNQIVTIQRWLAEALVALERPDLAEAAFVEALARQPDLELDAMRTSPRVLAVFRRAQQRARGRRGARTR